MQSSPSALYEDCFLVLTGSVGILSADPPLSRRSNGEYGMVSFCPFGSYKDNTEQSKDQSNKIEVELHIISNPFRSAILFVFGTERAFCKDTKYEYL